jgi:hypothetical protein
LGYLSHTGNWEIDLVVQRIGAYDLNHSFAANLEAFWDKTKPDEIAEETVTRYFYLG